METQAHSHTPPSFPAPPRATFTPPPQIDEFRLVRALGEGAMGQVHLGHDELLDRLVAVKFIAARSPDESTRLRFLTEARAIARLQHPNVVSIYRVGEFAGHPYLVSEFVHGLSLSDLPRPVPWRRALAIFSGAARGLAAAHRHGVLHRDIKPANIMLTDDDQVKLLDFGLAKLSVDSAQRSGAPFIDSDPLDPTGRRAPRPTPQAALSPSSIARSEAERRSSIDSSALSQDGAIVGTPLYMSPEVRRGLPATRRSDIYSLGCVVFELCCGRAPLLFSPQAALAGARTETDAEAEPDDGPQPAAPGLREVADAVDPAFADVVDRCLRPQPDARYASADELWDALAALEDPGAAPAPPDAGSPYPGLRPFNPEDRACFFGRAAEIRAVTERLRTEPLVLVAGGSGTGKSSLCRAGILPRAAEGALDPGGAPWDVVRVAPGRRPVQGLLSALGPLLGAAEATLMMQAFADPDRLAATLRGLSQRSRGVLIFIDQLEELFTRSDPADRAVFSEIVEQLAAGGPALRVLLAVRGDFLTQLLALPALGAEVGRALYLLRPLSPDGVREAVVGPARLRGVRFESDSMIAALVESAVRGPGMALLQFALAELWDQHNPERRLIPAAALLQIGGVEGALARHADSVLSRLSTEQRQVARRLLTRLVGADGGRLRRSRADLCQDDGVASAVLEVLVEGRLVSASEADAGTAYEIMNDALLTGWDTLRQWLDRGADLRAAYRRVESAAGEWERLSRSDEALWHAAQLGEVAFLDPAELWPREAAFLRASRRLVRRQRRLRLLALMLGPLLLLLGFLGTRLLSQRALDRAVAAHLDQAQPALTEARALADQVQRLRQQALERFDTAGAAETAEILWAATLSQQGRLDERYSQASDALEAALILDSARADVRRLLAEVTCERLWVLLERGPAPRGTDELLRRLGTFDVRGDLLLRMSAPARLSVETDPPGATVDLSPLHDRDGRLIAGRARRLGRAPVPFTEAPAGSYRIEVHKPGRAPVLLPLLLSRGERTRLSLWLPREDQVPPGYVYVPPGDFLYGSADDEDLRRGFLNAAPLHRVHTGGYLIGRTEVTFADWLEFLRALPPAERARHTPGGDNAHGLLRLLTDPDGVYRLELRPTTRVYTARAGEPMRFLDRDRNQAQDWRQFPVAAISFEDARAYAGWLSRTGRLPGARVCDEHEWERAARGADGRRYPHGARLLPDEANFAETYGRRPLSFGPDVVGSHPASQSPSGLLDTSGNVWEMTAPVGASASARQVVYRGGGWYYEALTNRTMNREVTEGTEVRDSSVGVRLCATLKPADTGAASFNRVEPRARPERARGAAFGP